MHVSLRETHSGFSNGFLLVCCLSIRSLINEEMTAGLGSLVDALWLEWWWPLAPPLALYFGVFLVGWHANRLTACRWMQANASALRLQFAALGARARKSDELQPHEVERPLKSGLLIADGARTFRFYASGRELCHSILVQLELKPRQDLLSLAYSLFYRWEDTIFVDVPMANSKMPPFVFSIVRDVDVKFCWKSMIDIALFTREVPLELLPRNLVCLTDCSELVPHLLTPKVVRILFDFRDEIELVHFSDQNSHSGFGPNSIYAKALRFRFKFPKRVQDSAKLMQLVFDCIDLVGSVDLSPMALADAKAARRKAKGKIAALVQQKPGTPTPVTRQRSEEALRT